ncbi:hypothetical protein D9M68_837790 [compost metagenome]
MSTRNTCPRVSAMKIMSTSPSLLISTSVGEAGMLLVSVSIFRFAELSLVMPACHSREPVSASTMYKALPMVSLVGVLGDSMSWFGS